MIVRRGEKRRGEEIRKVSEVTEWGKREGEKVGEKGGIIGKTE